MTSSRNGSCVNQIATLIGLGKLALGSIVSQLADVGVFGSGNAFVQAKEKPVATITDTGDLHYVDVEPGKAVVRGFPPAHRGHHSYEKKIKYACHKEYDAFEPYLPRHKRIPRRVVVRTKHNRGFISVDDDDDDNDSSDASVSMVTDGDDDDDSFLVITPFDSDNDHFSRTSLLRCLQLVARVRQW